MKSEQQNIFMWTLSFVTPYRTKLLLVLLCGVLVSAAEMAIPRSFQYIIDVIFPQNDYQLLAVLSGVIVGIVVIMICAMLVMTIVQRQVGERASSDMQFAVFKHLRSLGFSYFEQNPVGESVTLMNHDVTQVQSFFRSFLPSAFTSVMVILISFGFLIGTNLQLSVVLIPSLALYILLGPYLNQKRSEYDSKWIRLQGIVGQKTYDAVSATLELRHFSNPTWKLKENLQELDLLQKTHLKHLLYLFLAWSYRVFCIHMGAAIMFGYGAYLVVHGSMTVGEFIAFNFYFFLMINRMMDLMAGVSQQRTLLMHASRLQNFMLNKPKVNETRQPIRLNSVQGRITFKNVHFSYGDSPVLNGIDFAVKPGEKIALVGESGNGKTTMMKLIPRFYDPDQGQILLDDVPISKLSFEQLRGAMGIVFQETYLFGASVLDNIRFGKPDATKDEIIGAAKAAYAHEFILEMKDGYDTHIGERGVKLSGGQRQRLSIARMFVCNPSIILLDEATSSLDNDSEREVQKALDRLLIGRTTVTIAHRLSTVKHYDRILLIVGGRIAEEGTYEELLVRKGAFYRLAEGQKKEDSEGGT